MYDDLIHMIVHQCHKVVDISIQFAFGAKICRYVCYDIVYLISGCKYTVDGRQRITSLIQCFDFFTQFMASLCTMICSDLRNLISYRIQDHRRMIVVFAYHCGHIFFPPFTEVQTIIQIGFATIPHIKCFVHYIHSQLITSAQHCRSHRMVRHTDRIKSGFF